MNDVVWTSSYDLTFFKRLARLSEGTKLHFVIVKSKSTVFVESKNEEDVFGTRRARIDGNLFT